MSVWDYILVSYGLVIAPLAGIRLIMWRAKGGIKSFREMLIYLLAGIINIGATFFTILILPEGNWLQHLAIVIFILSVCAYGYFKVDIRND